MRDARRLLDCGSVKTNKQTKQQPPPKKELGSEALSCTILQNREEPLAVLSREISGVCLGPVYTKCRGINCYIIERRGLLRLTV